MFGVMFGTTILQIHQVLKHLRWLFGWRWSDVAPQRCRNRTTSRRNLQLCGSIVPGVKRWRYDISICLTNLVGGFNPSENSIEFWHGHELATIYTSSHIILRQPSFKAIPRPSRDSRCLWIQVRRCKNCTVDSSCCGIIDSYSRWYAAPRWLMLEIIPIMDKYDSIWTILKEVKNWD